ncbi:integrin alpha fg-gap repeat 1 [Ichthyophthirius multifiliis]|uniref:Integrin alpha fg-gap repeat 1 n=1 Tax=Ichthyophthirius multifiliis TaxID=5932 RepID=G0R1U0_ICHMU|nr:integrin alpha fg-gap repeat 1 [Ichthyophthirius multifiliis]EGR28592.1 integrin alpha fg-gap repeat 1 [Ichthyophthirius multifiliis]|eukprot:XP_004029828.1 integrin alpha fg-gap repeat 1 [Ichthyophthirius multifiliis]
MDIFSLGCLISDLYLDGEAPLFTYDQQSEDQKGLFVPELHDEYSQELKEIEELIIHTFEGALKYETSSQIANLAIQNLPQLLDFIHKEKQLFDHFISLVVSCLNIEERKRACLETIGSNLDSVGNIQCKNEENENQKDAIKSIKIIQDSSTILVGTNGQINLYNIENVSNNLIPEDKRSSRNIQKQYVDGEIRCLETSVQLRIADDFKAGLFKFNTIQSGIYQIDIGDLNDDLLMAYGDFDGNKSTDIVTLSSQNIINICLWQNDGTKFKKHTLQQSKNEKCQGNIVNIIPGDVNYDGNLDLVLIKQTQDKNIYCLNVLIQKNCSLNDCQFINSVYINIEMDGQPFAADFLGQINQKNFQLMYFSQNENKRKIINFLQNEMQQIEFSTLISLNSECIQYPQQFKFANPHFSSFLDFNGDCRADLVIHSINDQGKQQVELWEKLENNKFCLKQIQISKSQDFDLKSFTLLDINFDGSVDFIALVQNKNTKDSTIVISYNKNNVDPSNLCQRFSKQSYEDFSIQGPYTYHQQLTFVPFSNKQENLVFIRLQDVDLDGMPDLILTSDNQQEEGKFVILENKKCKGKQCDTIEAENPRLFVLSSDQVWKEMNDQNAHTVSFFDINEDGKIDFFINTKDYSSGKNSIKCFFNYISTDAFFIKALGLNGQCNNNKCQSGIYYGATYECKVTTLDTTEKVATGVQLSQSAYRSLQLPFVILGLARTNNYIENLTVGLSLNEDKQSRKTWTPIIPNSQLIIYPLEQKNKWVLSIFVQPNEALLIIIIVTVLLLVGIIIKRNKKTNKDK